MAFLTRKALDLARNSSKYLRSWGPSVTRQMATMDDDGDRVPDELKTTVTILNKDEEEGIFIQAYSPMGFKLTSGIRVMGPCAVFPRSIMHWNIPNAAAITPESLSLFTMLEPKLDLLILGLGERDNVRKLDKGVIKYLRQHKLNFELLSTDQALSTFNFLNSEQRYVAAALVPPAYMENVSEQDEYNMLVDNYLDPQEKDYMFGNMELQTKEELEQYKNLTKEAMDNVKGKLKVGKEKDPSRTKSYGGEDDGPPERI